MAGWLIPALKAVLPHVGDILSAAKPAFTKRKPDGDLVQQQIAELQAAVSQQAGHIKELAPQLQSTASALEQAALLAEQRLGRSLIFTPVVAALGVTERDRG